MSGTVIKNPKRAASTGAYSDGILVDGWLFVSGQGPIDVATGQVVPGSIEDEVRVTLRNLGEVLAAAGCSYKDVVRCTCHLARIEDFDRFNETYQEFFSQPLPTRTTVQSVLGLGIKVEIDAIARVPSQAKESR